MRRVALSATLWFLSVAALAQTPVAIDQIVVTPSQFDIYRSEPAELQMFGRDEVRRLPHIGDDLYRALAYVPGAAAGDISARVNIRGGEEDESIVLLDGAEIYDPFHMRDLFRAFSTIDAESVGAVEMITGGFPAEYGGRMSGVIDISTLSPEARSTELGVSILNTRVLSVGKTKGGSEWLVSARRGYLRDLIRLVANRDELDPTYYDVLAKYQWAAGRSTIASAHVLASHDRLRLTDVLNADAHASYTDAYVWLTLRSAAGKLSSTTVATYGHMARERNGIYGTRPNDSETGNVSDERTSSVVAVKNDSTFAVSERQLAKAGVNVRAFDSRFDYSGSALFRRSFLNPSGPAISVARTANVRPSSTSLALYAADRLRLGQRVVAEAGLRAESESHTPDGTHVSPRVNVAWLPTNRSAVRMAWGRYGQAEMPYELAVEDGQTSLTRAQEAEHRIVSAEYAWPFGLTTRVEAYDKIIRHPHTRFENIYDRFDIFPELRPDRIAFSPSRSRARGAELLLRKESRGRLSGWLTFTHARAIDTIDGVDVPRSWDQPNAVTFSANFRAASKLNLNLSGNWHSGRPTTPLVGSYVNRKLVTALGVLNSQRLPDYRRVDFRASREVALRRGRASLFVELFNVFNNANVSRVASFRYPSLASAPAVATPVTESVVGIVPSFGATWQF